MKSPLVSIIIPCYNYAKYVEQAIESAQNQTYKNLELVVINDGSTDNSDAVIRGLRTKYNFMYHAQENKGVVATRNKGVNLAKGEYVIQLDADDWLERTYVNKTLQHAQKHKLDIVYTQAVIFGRVEFTTNYPEFDLEYLKHDGHINASALVHKNVFRNHKYDEYLTDKGNEDWDLFLGACLDGATAGLVDEPLLHYRKHNGRASRADKFEGTRKELLVRHHILNKQNAKHPEQMWYFSPYINMLKKFIDNFERVTAAEAENAELQKQVTHYRNMYLVRLGRKLRRLLRKGH